MRLPLIPSRATLWVMAGAAFAAVAALVLQVPQATVTRASVAAMVVGAAWALIDIGRSMVAWRHRPLVWKRRVPAALALDVQYTLACALVNEGPNDWRVEVVDQVDPSLDVDGLPIKVLVPAEARTEVHYNIVPRHRGLVRFHPAALRVRTLHGTFEWMRRAGEADSLRVYPDFAAVSRYAWLASHRRLGTIGIQNVTQRGTGTDFKQLAHYQKGDATRHIDWKATLRQGRPIVRQFQDERDQCVMFLLDCGRHMSADEGQTASCRSHFDEALNAMVLLAHVALEEGDAVGAMTFGGNPADLRRFAPHKGPAALNSLMATFYDVQPTAAPSDYRLAACALMKMQKKRALIVVLTSLSDENLSELEPALHLLRSRHLVLLPLLRDQAPAQLPAELVNHYRVVKRSRLL